MPDISKVTLPSGSQYDVKDATARQDIADIKVAITGGMTFLGVTTTELSDGATTNPIKINDADVTAINGNVVVYGKEEFLFTTNDNAWHELGSTGALRKLAFKDSATGKVTPTGTVSAPIFTGTKSTISANFTPSGKIAVSVGSGTANYTPSGTVGNIAVTTTPTTEKVNSVSNVGTLASCKMPTLTMSVADENLTFTWADGSYTQGTLPTVTEKSVLTGVDIKAAAPTFTGTGVDLEGTFTGDKGSVSADYTPEGTVSAPTFTGNEADVTVE